MDEFGLINMNGRVYDPSVGRFLSPDNEVQAPDNSQSYNRYAYCMNNPSKYTDPTGYLWYRDNWGQWNYWDEPGSNDKDIDPSTLTSEEYTLSPTDRVLVCGFWNNGKFKLSDSFSYFNLYAVSLTKEGKEHKKEEEAAKQAAKDKTNTKSVAEKRKEDIANLKAKNGGSRSVHWDDEKYGLGKLFGPGRSDIANYGNKWGKADIKATINVFSIGAGLYGAIEGAYLSVRIISALGAGNAIDNNGGYSANLKLGPRGEAVLNGYKMAVDALSLKNDIVEKSSLIIIDMASIGSGFDDFNALYEKYFKK